MSAGRILMTADAVGGVWTYALDLAGVLAELGVATTLAVLGPAPVVDQRAEARGVAGLELVETGLPLDWIAGDAGEIEAAAAALQALAREARVDLVHLNSPALAVTGSFPAPVLGVCHSCLATWWAAVKDGPMPEDFRWRSQVLWRGLLACDALAAPTDAFASATARTYDVPVPFLARNGRTRGGPVRRAPGPTTVFTAGRLWDDGKNLDVLDAAAALTLIPVRAAGPVRDPAGGSAKSFANLQLLGRLSSDGVRRQLASSPIYASSALYEPFGLGVLEAAQAGCALVLSDIPTFRELWDGVALFASPRDPAAFAGAFNTLAADPERMERLSRAARRRAGRYSSQAMGDDVLAIYAQLGLHADRREAAA